MDNIYEHFSQQVEGFLLAWIRRQRMSSVYEYRVMAYRAKAHLLHTHAVGSGPDAVALLHRARLVGRANGYTAVDAIRTFMVLMSEKTALYMDAFGLSAANIRSRFEDAPPEVDRNERIITAIIGAIHDEYERLYHG